ncbi:hypothetical protein [Rhizobium leguminosarum]|uniref:hypothetical protein n=2 Tax=Rhizobium/Agrobacterium group TaxID=227290 RepID=UPI0013BAB2DB|nr:hypothetical protein [Rhizobium leguminosarum]MBY5387688.1 hypothetical protein [Rhizobium leguminosarum]MBY5428284.1 hypothetical protein [Rhizobium leguminosarum]NEK45497.1 hypothetical protein [Rhizobium leguminosarum]
MSEEDARFGRCAVPTEHLGIYPHEIIPPKSLVTLTDETAPMIRSFFNLAQEQTLFTPIPISVHVLWIMDCSCKIHLALEEMIDITRDNAVIGVLPKASSAQPPRGSFKKPGHPTLLPKGETDARIAGEIYFDPEKDPSGKRLWCLTNESGRYGLRAGQSRDHLEAICGIFEEFELYFSMRYVKPTA